MEGGGWKDFKGPKQIGSSPGSTPRVIRPVEVAVVSTSSPTLSVSSAFLENKSVQAVFLTTVFIKKKKTHDFVLLKKLLILCPLMCEYKAVNISKSHYMKFIINHLFLGTKLCCIMF